MSYVWSLRRTVSYSRITIILRLPDNYNRCTGLQTSVGGLVCTACKHRRADMYSITIFATSLKLLKKPSTTGKLVETKTAQYMHDIEPHFTEKRTQTRKLNYRNQKDVD